MSVGRAAVGVEERTKEIYNPRSNQRAFRRELNHYAMNIYTCENFVKFLWSVIKRRGPTALGAQRSTSNVFTFADFFVSSFVCVEISNRMFTQ